MQITKLEYQKNNPNRVNVFVDGKFAVGLEVNDVLKLGLANGQEINQEELNKIIEQSNFGKAFNAAVNFLSFRPRSEWEVRQYLTKKMNYELRIKNYAKTKKRPHNSYSIIHDSGDVDRVIDKLKGLKLLDDQAFAQWWAEQRSQFRPKGQRAINAELARKGVKVKIKLENEAELASKLLAKKTFTSKDQAFRHLLSRGFSYDKIESVIEKAKIKE